MGEYTKTEFITGFEELGWNSMADLQSVVKNLKKELRSGSEFPKIYKFVFNFLKGEDARNVNVDYAVSMWELLFKEYYGDSITPFLEKWKAFLENQKETNGLNGIKKDEWNSLLDLFKDKGILLEGMKSSDEDLWPILFDNFFEYLANQ